MAWNRGRAMVLEGVVRTVAMLPVLALVASAVMDRGPGRAVRLSLFPVALTVLDDFAWECARNSLILASLVTLAARVVGVGLARIVVRRRHWARAPLFALACVGMVVPPAFEAIGLRYGFGGPDRWPASVIWSWPGTWAGHAAWFWVSLTTGAPLVAFAAGSALTRVDPLWEDAGRLAGASRQRVWRRIVWPVIRPEVARALALVFTLTLIEPGAPLVLGLRRTLGYQIAEAALDPEVGRLTHATILTLAGVLAASLGRTFIRWWGGPRTPAETQFKPSLRRPEGTTLLRSGVFLVILMVAASLAWMPLIGLTSASLNHGLGTFGAVFRDPLMRRYVINSAVLGLAVVALDLVLARALAAWTVDRRGHRRSGRQTDWPEMVPPLAIGVGFLAMPWALRMVADTLRASGPRSSGVVEVLKTVADALDPDRTPWIALIVAVGLARLPFLKRSAVERRLGLRPSRVDAAITLGATRRQSRRALSGRLLGASPSAALITLVLSATSVTPALLLAPTAETRPIGPAVLLLIDEPGGGLDRAAALAILSIATNLAALAIAASGARSWQNQSYNIK